MYIHISFSCDYDMNYNIFQNQDQNITLYLHTVKDNFFIVYLFRLPCQIIFFHILFYVKFWHSSPSADAPNLDSRGGEGLIAFL